MSDGVFVGDKNLQYAVAYAMDFNACNLLQNDGKAERAYTMWAKGQYGHYDGYEHMEHNLEKAKDYLAKSNHPNGCDIKLVFHNAKHANVAALVQEQLKKININASIIETDLAGMRTMLQGEPGQYDCGLSAISLQAIGDRFHFIGQEGSATNRAKYYDDYIQSLYDKALAETDDATRKAIYKEIQEIIFDVKPYVPMYYGVEAVAWHKGVTGVIWSPDTKPDFTHIMWEE
jgi:peptide/nickel transport system substrate-binding protein